MFEDMYGYNPAPVEPTKNIDVEAAGKLPKDEDGIIQFVTKEEIIGDIISKYPDVAMVLLNSGMHCITCGAALYESLEEACYVHGMDPDDVAKDVNDYLTDSLNIMLAEQAEKAAAEGEEKKDEKNEM